MRKWIVLFLGASAMQAQETGAASVESAQVAQASQWQNWTFAGTAMVTAAAGVCILAADDGHSAQVH